MLKVQVDKLHTLTGHNQSVYALQPSSKLNVVFSAAGDGMVAMWDLEQPESGHLVARLSNSIYALHFHQPSNLLIAGHNYDGIHLLDWEERKEVGSLQLTGAAIFDIQSLGQYLFIATGDGTLIKVDCRSLTIVGTKQLLSQKSARTIAVNAHTGEVAVGYSDHFIRVYSADDLSLIREWRAHQNSVFTLRYDAAGTRLFSGSRDARLKAWNVQSKYGLQQEVIAHLYAINHLDLSPDGKHFVTCSMDRSVKVWGTDEMRLLKVIDRARHAGHGTSVNKVLWTSFHQQLLSASDDRTISVWNINFENDLL
ncbi:WD40 repeat domain-containing protein [Chryseolinea sp. T2]|uniref:WD40 repeat domain-containing protein n=1 Tax=Chryseolinea sp. T2 TaxID=3129255 RepID=UPI003076BFE9